MPTVLLGQHKKLKRLDKLLDKIAQYGNKVKSDFSGLRLDDMEEYFGDFFSR